MRFGGVIRFVAAFAYMVLAMIVLGDLSAKLFTTSHLAIRVPLFAAPGQAYASATERNVVWGCWGGSVAALAAALGVIASGASGEVALVAEAVLVAVAAVALIAAVVIHATRHWMKGATPESVEAQNIADEFR